MKTKKQKVAVRWEILSTFQDVTDNYGENKDVPASDKDFFKRNFTGNYIDLLNSCRIEPVQKWNVNIKTKLRLDDGQEGWHEIEFKPDTAMTLNELLKGNKHIKLNVAGIKVKWKGVTLMWIDAVEEDLPSSTCLEAWVTATCVADVKPLMMNNLLARIA